LPDRVFLLGALPGVGLGDPFTESRSAGRFGSSLGLRVLGTVCRLEFAGVHGNDERFLDLVQLNVFNGQAQEKYRDDVDEERDDKGLFKGRGFDGNDREHERPVMKIRVNKGETWPLPSRMKSRMPQMMLPQM
jgi:hypothetical protein